MKKIFFRLAFVVALALPIMMACDQQNNPTNPTDPTDPEECTYDPTIPDQCVGSVSWFNYWVNPFDDKQSLEINPQNIAGIWKLRAYAEWDPASSDVVTFVDEVAYDPDKWDFYWQINADGKEVFYEYSFVIPEVREDYVSKGEWSLDNAYITRRNSGIINDRYEGDTYKVEVLESNHLVVSRSYAAHFAVMYQVYERVDQLPPANTNTRLADHLVANRWQVTSDFELLTAFRPSTDPTDASGGTLDTISFKENQFVDFVFVFSSDSTARITRADGKTLAYTWTILDENLGNISVELKTENDELKWPSEFRFGFDRSVPDEAVFVALETNLPAPEGYDYSDRVIQFETIAVP